MDKDKIDKEFEGLLIYNQINYSGNEAPDEDDSTPCMSLVELSGIAQDLNSMLWYLQELMTRVYEENEIEVGEEVVNTLRRIQQDSTTVIEGIEFEEDDGDD